MVEKNLYPLSHPQKRIWYTEQRYPQTSFANVSYLAWFSESINTLWMQQAVNIILFRHEGLRLQLCVSAENEFEVSQYVVEQSEYVLPVFDFSSTGVMDCKQWAQEQSKTPFTLLDTPLFNFALAIAGKEQTGLLIKLHHIISDGWTGNLLMGEIITVYRQLCEGVTPESLMSTGHSEYLTCLSGEEKYENSAAFQKDRAYWLGKFADLPEEIDLSFTKKKNDNITSVRSVFQLPAEQLAILENFCSEHNITLFNVILAGLCTYIYRVTGKEDVVIAIPQHGRNNKAEKMAVGMFVSTLALRLRLTPEMNFLELVAQVGGEILSSIRHRRYPYEQLMQELQEKQGGSFNLSAINLVQLPDAVTGAHSRVDYYSAGADPSPLSLIINNTCYRRDQTSLEMEIDYQPSLYQTDDIDRLFTRLTALLADAVSQPAAKLSELNSMSPAEKRQILTEFNATAATYPLDKTVAQLFAEQAARQGDKIAVVYKEQTLTYEQLNTRANQLAHVLISKGIGPDHIVGILVDRSLEMIVGTLAIIKAGGAYLPIDPGYPVERIQYMLTDSHTTILLSQEHLRTKTADFTGQWLDLCDPVLYSGATDNPNVPLTPQNLVYIIYTSGSTGNPKGVMIEHRALVNLCTWQNSYHNVTENDNTAEYSGFGFDASVWEIFPFLLAGSTLHVIDDELRLSPLQLNEYFETHNITIADLPTQFAEQFMEFTDNHSLRCLVIGGDKLKAYRPQPYKVVNEYGPTEYTISATAFVIDGEYDNIPIGKPLANTRIYILDKYNALLPIGVPGELCIAGAQLARGYLGRPELTAEKFVADPFVVGEKMYKTGDLACWLPDGNIIFYGRLDDQIKIRGYRIELGEIEQQLVRYEGVTQAVVLDKEDQNGNKYLCAYIVATQPITASQLQEYLAALLPDYMIPPYIIQLPEMPVTTNGKVDRRALPAPDLTENDTLYVAPSNELEERLAVIWQEVLGLSRIGVEDNFFALGGHSLKAMLLQNKLQKLMQVRLSIPDIFQLPTIRAQAARLERQQHQKEQTIQQTSEADCYPLSAPQQRMYIMHQVDKESTAYQIPFATFIRGAVDKKHLAACLQTLIDRHESLRTSFVEVDGEIRQKIAPQVELVLDYREEPEWDNQPESINGFLASYLRPISLEAPPLIRVLLVQLQPEHYLFVVVLHHIIADGISFDIFLRELSSLYRLESLPALSLRYRDFAVWQQEGVASPAMQKQKEYWLEVYAEEVPLLQMPTDRPRPPVRSFKGERLTTHAGADLTASIQKLANATGATLFMVLLAAYKVLLAKYSGQEDVVVGTPAAGRNHSALDDLIGMFVTTSAIRSRPVAEKSFRDFLAQVRQSTLGALEHQEYPFEQLVTQLAIARDTSRNPLFDVMFGLENESSSPLTLGSLPLEVYPLPTNAAQFDLTLDVMVREMELTFSWEFATDLFDQTTVQRIATHFCQLLSAITANPDQLLGEYSLLSAKERQQLLVEFNDTALAVPQNKTLPQLFTEMAQRYPDKVALVYKETTLTYRQLNEKVNQLAHRLVREGLVADKIAAIMVDRSPAILIGALAIMKAGGAYLPIDPAYPADRITYMLSDSQACLLLTQTQLQAKVAQYTKTVLDLEEETLFSAESVSEPQVLVLPEHLAYVIYTSGSTGQPKGVMIEQRHIVNLCAWQNHFHQVTASDKAAAYSGFGFDASIWEMFPFITCGAALHILPEEIRLSIEELNRYFTTHQITITNLPTQLCEQFIETVEETSLTTLVTGGDKLRNFIPRPYRLVNEYGPTEYTISATYFVVDKKVDNIPIGKPLANTWLYVLDRQGALQPMGVPGELCIAGAQLARGYLGRPELTAEKFVANPFATGVDNAKLYKTGDLVRWLADGNIEFLGRIDQQVKIRGYRIELGEIEQRLLQHPAVRDAVVLDKNDANGNKYLCAYVVGAAHVVELKEFLAQELPEYMVPGYILLLDMIPLTANGKVDRRALPEPDISSNSVEYLAPGTEIEKALAQCWQEVLGVDRVGTQDNFFALGGDSIKAIQMISRLAKYQLKVEMKYIFQHPTIKELSRYTIQAVRTVDQRPVEGKVELTPIQQWFFKSNFTDQNHWNQSILLLRKTGIDVEAVTAALTAVVTHHDGLRMVYRCSATEVTQYNRSVIETKPLFHLNVVENRQAAGVALEAFLATEANQLQTSIDISTGPLLRAAVCKTNQGDYLIVVVHHLVMDGISWHIMQEDLATAYQQAVRQEKIKLPEKTDSYQQWSQKLQEYALSHKLLAQCDYWKKIEQENSRPLPVDQVVVGKKKIKDNGVVAVTFTAEETTELLTTVHAPYHTEVNDILLAALALAVEGWVGHTKTLVTLEGHGREEIIPEVDISRTVGWFTSTYPVLLDVARKNDVGYVLKSIKENLRRIPNHGIGSDMLRHITPPEISGVEYRLTPEIEFNYLGEVDNHVESGEEIFSLVTIGVGEDVSADAEMDFKLLVSGMVLDGKLKITIEYSTLEYEVATMEKLLQLYQKQLQRVCHHCKNCSPEITPSDLGDVTLTLAELDTIKELYGNAMVSVYSLSPMQEGMLFLSRLNQGSSAYFEQEVVDIKGDIATSLFEKNLNDMIARHDILRTAFVFDNISRARQVVLKERPTTIYFEDISHLTEAKQQEYVEKIQKDDRDKGFDLTRDHLLRCYILKLAERHYSLIYSFPHIILDGWCMAKFTAELFDGYVLQAHNRPVPFVKSPPFKNYIDWLDAQDKEVALQAWADYLAGLKKQTQLPMQCSVAKNEPYQPADVKLVLERAVTQQLNELAQQYKVTLNNVMQAVWGVLLQHYCRQNDVVFGMVVSGRPPEIPEVDQIMGLFINTVPVRVKTDKDTTFIELIQTLQTKAGLVEPYTYCSLAEIQARSALKEGLINHLVAFENMPMREESADDDFVVESVGGFDQISYNFGLVIIPAEEMLVRFSYNAAVFAPMMVENMALHFQKIIAQLLGDPHSIVSQLDIIGESAISPMPDQEYYSLSPAQERMFVLEQLEDIGCSHHVTSALILEGALDKEKLSQAIAALVNRYEIVRTSVIIVDNQPMQQIQATVKYKRVLREIAAESGDEELTEIVQGFVKKFNVLRAPLFRLELLVISSTKHVLLFDFHPMIMDDLSMKIFFNELFTIYQGGMLTPLPFQYRDIANWQQQRAATAALRGQEQFWLKVFEGSLPILNLPTDYPRPAVRSYAGKCVTVSLDEELTNSIKQVVQKTQIPLATFFLAAYYVLLAKYASQEDIIVGVPFGGREYPELEKVVGRFATTLPLRAYPTGAKPFLEFLNEVANSILETVENQEYPVDQLIEKLNVPQQASRNPLFDVLFSFTQQESYATVEGLRITPWEGAERAASFDVTLTVSEQKNTMDMTFTYSTALFNEDTISRMAGHFTQLLTEVTQNVACTIDDISILSQQEVTQLLVDFNNTSLSTPQGKTIQELFTMQAEKYPDQIALVFRNQQWTYSDLDEITNQLARTLRAKGVCPDEIVAIMVGRSADIIIGTLAILKAGGAYLPIDPDYPLERISYMLSDSKARILLSQEILRDKAQAFDGEWLDVGDANLYLQDGETLPLVNQASDLAYIIYTSGSTGKPKGVMIEHRNLINLCVWQQGFHQVTAADHAATYSGFGFDASIWEMYPFLTIGATLHIIPEELRLSPTELNDYFERHEISITNLPTQFCEQFMELVSNRSLKTLVTGGDKLKAYHLQNFRLVNEYGPTEYTISATAFEVDRQYTNIPIGKPVANTWAYVVNRHGGIQPIGVPGELCLAGAGLARGYLNQPALTAEKFVENPFTQGDVNAKMYRTGDLVRWLPDGNIEFLGRVDQQVKIRGYRIELGEIEQQLLAYPDVHAVVVIDVPDAKGEKYLVAYFAMVNPGAPVDSALLKAHLSQTLPEYMIPTVFMELPIIPLTANGKIDRRALPLPDVQEERGTLSAAPTTLVEQKIANVWQDVLGIAEIGVHDNFFSLGGNSLKVVAAVAKLQRNFEVSVNQLFEYQTIAALASRLTLKSNNLKNKLAELKEWAQEMDQAVDQQEQLDAVGAAKQAAYQRANEKYQQLDLEQAKPYEHILLTGATGYLGIHLVTELLASTKCHITLLVRGATVEEAQERVLVKAAHYFGESSQVNRDVKQRLTIINGSLEQENFGLSPETYSELAQTIDVIIHAAANVRHYGHYSEFWQSNVQATHILLQFAQTGKRKDFNYISTISVASGIVAGQSRIVFTEEETDVGQELENYYLKTKLEAEKAVVAARDTLSTNIFRVGNIVFHSKTGVYQDNIEDNAFYSQMKAFINLGVVPNMMDEAEFSYVDYVAKSIVLLFDRQALENETYHIYNTQIVKQSEILTEKSLGLSVQAVDFSGFVDHLYQNYDHIGCKEYISNVMLHFGWLDEESTEEKDRETEFVVLSDKTNALLARRGFYWEELQPMQMKKMIYQALQARIAFLRQIPFLSSLSIEETEKLAGLAIQKSYDDEQDILWEDEMNDQFHLIMEGFAEVSRNSLGGWQGTLAVAGAGSIIGEENIMAATPSSVTVEAIMGETVTLAFPGERVRALIREKPQLALALLQAMNDKIRRLEKMVISMA